MGMKFINTEAIEAIKSIIERIMSCIPFTEEKTIPKLKNLRILYLFGRKLQDRNLKQLNS